MISASPVIHQNAFPLASVPEWFAAWPPREKQAHWRDGKSAKELAKQWFPASGGPVIPAGFRQLLESHPRTACLRIEHARGEKVVLLDDSTAGHRNADLVLTGTADDKTVLVHIEAKADESFGSGRSVAAALASAPSAESKLPTRIANLSELLFDARELTPVVGALNYQLFYSIAATLMDAEAAGAVVAVFCVHELLPRDLGHGFVDEADGVERKLAPAQVAANGVAFRQMVEALAAAHPGTTRHGAAMWEIGDFHPYVGGNWGQERCVRPITLFVGKATDHTA